MDRQPLVSINIPCYRQLDLARRSVGSILGQSYSNLEITLLDDGASDDYPAYVESLGDRRVRYQRNPTRLGAMRNMFQAIGTGTGEYSMAFHEDDLLGAHYLSTAVDILERDPRCGFVGGEIHEFTDDPSGADMNALPREPLCERYDDGADFLRAIFRGVNPMFGSIVYRRSAVAGLQPSLDRYGTLADRPFLLAILEHGSAAIVRQPLVWYRHHPGNGDTRHRGMSADNIVQLLAVYRSTLPAPLSEADRGLLHFYTGYWLVELFRLLPEEARPSLLALLFRAWREGLYDPRTQRGHGRREVLRVILTGSALSA